MIRPFLNDHTTHHKSPSGLSLYKLATNPTNPKTTPLSVGLPQNEGYPQMAMLIVKSIMKHQNWRVFFRVYPNLDKPIKVALSKVTQLRRFFPDEPPCIGAAFPAGSVEVLRSDFCPPLADGEVIKGDLSRKTKTWGCCSS